MKIAKDGTFSITLSSEQLAAGLRPAASNPRNSSYMTELVGMVGRDKVLQTLEDLSELDTTGIINDGFPYPQLFILSKHTLVCGETKIYEYLDGSLILQITASAAGGTWRILDYVNYLCMSNGSVTIVRNPQTGVFSETTALPSFNAACDYNGQAFLGYTK